MKPTFQKYPEESLSYSFDFSAHATITAGDTLTQPATVGITGGTYSGELVIGDPAISGAAVLVQILGGALGDLFEITCTCATAGGSVVALAAYMQICKPDIQGL